MVILFLFFAETATAQFHVNGDAQEIDEHCYQLTPNMGDEFGTIWDFTKIDLREPFDTTVQIFLGCKDEGGDGIVFAFQPNGLSLGNYGGHLAYAFLSPTLAVEIDTYQNPEHNDPEFDHIAIIRDGITDHQSTENLAGPIQAHSSDPDVENCEFHSLRIFWNADEQELRVYFDCEFRLSYKEDVINSIFNGNPEVFWGFTSGTNTVSNEHTVCIGGALPLDRLDDITLCPGGDVELNAPIEGISYEWSPAEGLDETDIPNPVAAPQNTTTYTVIIIGECDELYEDDLTIFVEGTSVDLDFGSGDTVACAGSVLTLNAFHEGAAYLWSNGSVNSEIQVMGPGEYSLTLTNNNCQVFENISVNFLDAPNIELGADTFMCEGRTLLLDAFFAASSYLWQNGSTQPEIEINSPGIYEVVVVNPCGTDQDEIQISFGNCEAVYMPAVFSPNDDSVNDFLFVQSSSLVEEVLHFKIFDRWGGVVFEQNNFLPNDSSFGWNGEKENKKMQPGIYVYMVEVQLINGEKKIFKGEVLLLR